MLLVCSAGVTCLKPKRNGRICNLLLRREVHVVRAEEIFRTNWWRTCSLGGYEVLGRESLFMPLMLHYLFCFTACFRESVLCAVLEQLSCGNKCRKYPGTWRCLFLKIRSQVTNHILFLLTYVNYCSFLHGMIWKSGSIDWLIDWIEFYALSAIFQPIHVHVTCTCIGTLWTIHVVCVCYMYWY